MKLVRSAIIETPKGRFVEMLFSDGDPASPDSSYVSFRAPASAEGYSLLPEYHLEALRRVRTVVGDEIQRLSNLKGKTA